MEILPFYAVCDESSSMKGEPVQAINDALEELYQELHDNPAVTDKVRFCLIGFATEPEVLLPLSDLGEVDSMPGLEAEGWTYYGKAFELLRSTIEQDVQRLKAQGHDVLRPAVFFLSDGAPTVDNTEDWRDNHAALVSSTFTARPNIVAFGMGQCDPDTIRAVATFKAFIQKDDSVQPAQALREFAVALTRSIVTSAKNIGASRTRGSATVATLQVPTQVPGYAELPLDKV
jgi:uncharacterized protein YegL